jgi:integrase
MSDRSQHTRRGLPYPKQADNGFWYVHWSVGRRSKRESLGTKEKDEALARFAQWVLLDGSKKDGIGAEEVEYTVNDVWLVYTERHVNSDKVMPNGRDTIGYAWKNLQPHFGHLLVPQVDQEQVDDYAAGRAHVKRPGRPLLKLGRKAAPATIRREVATLFAALHYCAKGNGKLYPASLIEDVTLPADSPPRDRWLSMAEVQRLLDAAASMRRGEKRLTRGERFLWLALFTAGRKEAIFDLTWDRVDFETKTIHLNVPGRRITKKRRADVTIAAQLMPILKRAHNERISDLVLDNKASIWATVQHIAIKAGFSEQKVAKGKPPKGTGISPHVLRHTAATHMARRGVPLWKIANILGNTLAMTERVYAKWVPENPAGTVDQISNGVLEATQ